MPGQIFGALPSRDGDGCPDFLLAIDLGIFPEGA